MMFVIAQQLEQQMRDATWLLSDNPEMETSLYYMQLLLLVTSLEWLWRDWNDFFVGANLKRKLILQRSNRYQRRSCGWNKNSCFGNGWRNICDR